KKLFYRAEISTLLLSVVEDNLAIWMDLFLHQPQTYLSLHFERILRKRKKKKRKRKGKKIIIVKKDIVLALSNCPLPLNYTLRVSLVGSCSTSLPIRTP